MAGPVPTCSATQLVAQTAFAVPFGLLTLVNSAITAATAAGEFNVTVDCSLFVAQDVSNLRIYLDSEGYLVKYAKNSGNKSLLIDWSAFQVSPVSTVTVNQGTSPWVVSGTISTTPPANATTNLTQVGGVAISEGQKTSAASLPVVIAVDQSPIPVPLALRPLFILLMWPVHYQPSAPSSA